MFSSVTFREEERKSAAKRTSISYFHCLVPLASFRILLSYTMSYRFGNISRGKSLHLFVCYSAERVYKPHRGILSLDTVLRLNQSDYSGLGSKLLVLSDCLIRNMSVPVWKNVLSFILRLFDPSHG